MTLQAVAVANCSAVLGAEIRSLEEQQVDLTSEPLSLILNSHNLMTLMPMKEDYIYVIYISQPACVTSGHLPSAHKAHSSVTLDLNGSWWIEEELWREEAAGAEEVERGTGPCL